jgi:fructose-1,6-bisphosphatase/inositol monophosphatase family enzyme
MARHRPVDWVRVLHRAGLAGKRAILRNYNPASRNLIIKRGVGGDLTLKIDDASEKAIFSSLIRDLGGKENFVFLSEEVGEVSLEKGGIEEKPVVVCDPLDGSHNAQVGIPFFSLALSVILPGNDATRTRKFGSLRAGLILSIKTEDEYFAHKGGGAFHNGRPIKRVERPKLPEGEVGTLLIETGDIDYLREKILRNLSKQLVYKTRILGSAAMSYCMLADGSADAFIFAQPGGARTIDSPAGYLIAREAGCVFSSISSSIIQDVDEIKVGFDSRVNLLGASNSSLLSKLSGIVGSLD